MAIVLSFDICQEDDCSSLNFTDTTGAYSLTNPNGYGAPNESIAGATASLTFTLGNGTSFIIDITSSGFPTTDKTKELNILQTLIGYNAVDKIADQVIHVLYTVTTTTPTIYTQDYQFGLKCQIECCIRSMFADFDFGCSDCITANMDKLNLAYLMLNGLDYSSNCGDITTFNKTLEQLQKICNNSSCSNCK